MKYKNFKLKSFTIMMFVFAFILSANAQQLSVSGVVKDAANGEPIIGANILEKGTNNGTITNFDGEFTISVPSNATLVIKYVGYQAAEIPVAGKRNIVIELKEDAIALGEVMRHHDGRA